MTATKVPKEKIIDKIDTAIYKLPNSPKIELGDTLLNALSTGAEDILVNDYLSDKTIQEKTTEQLKDECKFDEIEDAFDEGLVPHQLEFFCGVDNENFVQVCNFLSLNEDNNEFVSFLSLDAGQNMAMNNSLSIHIESWNTFYNFNTNENFYSTAFLLPQQDESKQVIPKQIPYHEELPPFFFCRRG